MNDLLVAIGLVMVIEGLLWAVMPTTAFRMLQAAAESSEAALRIGGMIAVALGVLTVWLVRG